MPNFVIGLTGGIGSGKSEVAARFGTLGAEIIDADRITRELVAPGMPALEAISNHFGSQVLLEDGSLDRIGLRNLVFSDPEARVWLEKLLHPDVRKNIRDRIEQSTSPYVILVVPLLMESGDYNFIDRVLVVDAPDHLRVERVRQRDKCEESVVLTIMATQVDRESRLSRANDVIINDGPLDKLKPQIEKLHESYIQQAQHQTG